MTEREFAGAFATLAAQLQHRSYDTDTVRAYLAVLGDLSLPAVQQAAGRFARETGRRFMPTTAEWRTAALEIRGHAIAADLAAPSDREPWRHECFACEDTGWEQFDHDGRPLTCQGGEHGACGRKQGHQPHAFCRPCACRLTNRTYQRKQAALAGKVAS